MCPSSSAASKLIHEPHQKEQVSHKKKIPLKYYGLSAYNSTKKLYSKFSISLFSLKVERKIT